MRTMSSEPIREELDTYVSTCQRVTFAVILRRYDDDGHEFGPARQYDCPEVPVQSELSKWTAEKLKEKLRELKAANKLRIAERHLTDDGYAAWEQGLKDDRAKMQEHILGADFEQFVEDTIVRFLEVIEKSHIQPPQSDG